MTRHDDLMAFWKVGTVGGIDLIVRKNHDLYIGYLGGRGGMRGTNPGKLMEATIKDLAPYGEFDFNWDEVFHLVAKGLYLDVSQRNHIKHLCRELIEGTAVPVV